MEGVLAGDLPLVASGSRRGRAALFYPDRRRIHHPGPAWRFGIANDRADAVDRILFKSRLAGCIGHCDRSPRVAAGADPFLRTSSAAVARRRPAVKRGPSLFNIVAVAIGLAF